MYSIKIRKNGEAERRRGKTTKRKFLSFGQSFFCSERAKKSSSLRLSASPFFLFLCLHLVGCGEVEVPHGRKETFAGRYQTDAIYQAEVPLHWERVETEGDLTDTKQPIGSFKIGEGVLTVHNFPGQKIPPEAQIKRWQGQIPGGYYDVTPFSNGGFGGFRLEAINEEKGMIAYAMQLTPVIFRSFPADALDLKADYTIKFMGDIELNRADVDAFATSFEYIAPVEYGRL